MHIRWVRGLQVGENTTFLHLDHTTIPVIHVGMVILTMRRYLKCGDTSQDVLTHAGPPRIARF